MAELLDIIMDSKISRDIDLDNIINIIRHHVTSRHGVMMSRMTSLGKNTDKEGTKWKGRQCSGVFICFVHVIFLVLLVQYLRIQHMTDYVHHMMNSFWNWI